MIGVLDPDPKPVSGLEKDEEDGRHMLSINIFCCKREFLSLSNLPCDVILLRRRCFNSIATSSPVKVTRVDVPSSVPTEAKGSVAAAGRERGSRESWTSEQEEEEEEEGEEGVRSIVCERDREIWDLISLISLCSARI